MPTTNDVLKELKTIKKLLLGNGKKGVFELIRINAKSIKDQINHCKTRSENQDNKSELSEEQIILKKKLDKKDKIGKYFVRGTMFIIALNQIIDIKGILNKILGFIR